MLKGLSIIACLLMVSTLWGQTPSALWESATTYYNNEQYREALNLLDKYLAKDSTNPEAYKMRGNCHFEINQMNLAMADYKTAIQLDGTYADPYYNLANLYETENQPDSALHYFRLYTQTDSTDALGFERLGISWLMQNQSDSAILNFEKSYLLDSTSVSIVYYLTQEYYYSAQPEKAIAMAIRGNRLDSLEAGFYLYHGMCALEQGAFQEAIEQSERALELDSLDVDSYSLNLKARILAVTAPAWIQQDSSGSYVLIIDHSEPIREFLKRDTISYSTLWKRIKAGELLGLDNYLRFYLLQSEQPSYLPFGLSSNPRIKEYYNNEDYKALAQLSNEVLETIPLNLNDLLKVASGCYMNRNLLQFRKLYTLYFGLIEGILASGDGKSFTSAFPVVSTSDEYALLYYLGLQSNQQSLDYDHGHSYDILSATDETGNEYHFYFNIDLPFTQLSATFSGKKLKPRKKRKH